MNSLLRTLPAFALFAACSLPPVEEDATTEAVSTTTHEVTVEPEPWAPATPAWEQRSFEGVIEPASPGEVTWSSWPTHESDAEPQGSRMFLLERYQEVVDERDSLAREVMGLNATIDTLSAKITALETDLGQANGTAAARQTEISRLKRENTDLAERLTTAQIARLEAERILLEESIERIQVKALVEGEQSQTAPSTGTTQGAKQ
ncbi:MAG: hypothetical protein MK291_03095 [Planctomycetes bacterium]|nr:hypothetical protein [Planctomycetota bacterium]